MLITQLQKDSESFDLHIGLTTDEYTYCQLIDFRVKEDLYWEALRNDEDGTPHLIDAVSQVYQLPEWLEVSNGEDDLQEMFKSGWTIKADIDEVTVERLYVHFVNTVNFYFRNEVLQYLETVKILDISDKDKEKVYELIKYIKESYSTSVVANASLIFAEMTGLIQISAKKLSFYYKGHTYNIYANQVDKYFSNRFTVLESKEVLEFRRLVQNKAKQDDYNDSDGMDAFRLGLRPLSILARRDGEPLPKNKSERATFLDARERHLADIPMNIVYQVMFFFILTLADATKSRYINTFMEGSSKRNQKGLTSQRGIRRNVKQSREVRLSLRS